MKTEPVKTHWKKTFNKDYLGSHDLDNGKGGYIDLKLTVDKVKIVNVKDTTGEDKSCDVAYFKEKVKPMILNVGACSTLAEFAKSPYIEDWAGTKILVQVEKVKAFGSVVDALRINPKQPRTELPEMTPEHARWGDLVKAIVDKGDAAITAARKGFTISEEMVARLHSEAGIPQ